MNRFSYTYFWGGGGVFNYTFRSVYAPVNGRLINQWRTGKDVEGSFRDLFQGTIEELAWRAEENREIPQNSRYDG